MTATLNGLDVLAATITEPRIGVWSAVVDVSSETALSGKVTLTVDSVSWTGVVVKGDVHAGRVHAQIVGGAGKLATVLPAKFYRAASMRSILDDLMLATGEALHPATDDAIRTHTVSAWSRTQGKASAAIREVAAEIAVTWRTARSGEIWLGVEKWVDHLPDYEEIDRIPGRDSMTIAPTAPTLQPGVRFLGRNVSRVTTSVTAGGLRQTILFEVPGAGGRVADDIAAVISQHVDSKIDYSRMYPSKVLRQSSDGTLEILPDAEKLRGSGLTHVPIRHGIPGVTVKVTSGAKVLLFFENGDPKLMACALWPNGESHVTEVKIKTPTLIVDGDIVCSGEVTARSQTAPVALSSHIHGTAVGPSAPATPGAPMPTV